MTWNGPCEGALTLYLSLFFLSHFIRGQNRDNVLKDVEPLIYDTVINPFIYVIYYFGNNFYAFTILIFWLLC